MEESLKNSFGIARHTHSRKKKPWCGQSWGNDAHRRFKHTQKDRTNLSAIMQLKFERT